MLSSKILNKTLKRKPISVRFFSPQASETIYGYGDFLHPTYLPRPGSGENKRVALIPGIGIGQMFIESVEEIFKHVDVRLTLEKFDIKKIGEYDAILRGPTNENFETKDDIFLPQKLDLYAAVVHAFSIPGVKTRHNDIDIVVIRENSEGEYSTIEHEVLSGVVESIKVTTKEKSYRIAEYAFEYATLTNRSKVTVVHKANIIKKGDGDFLNAARQVSESYPRIKLEEMIVDAACMNLITHPNFFEVMLLPNLYGSIIGNVVSGLVGGPGIAPGAIIGKDIGMFEQGARCGGLGHLSTMDANPTAFILSSCMMLRYLNLPYYADVIQDGVFRTLRKRVNLTPDLGGSAKTKDFTKEVIKNIK